MVAMVTGLTAQVLIPRSLVNVSGERVKIWVVNDRNKPVILQQGSPVAQMELTDEIFESHKSLCNDRSDGLSAQGNRVNCVNDFNCFSSVDDFDEFYCSDDFNGSNFDFIDGGGFDNCFNDLDEVYCFADSPREGSTPFEDFTDHFDNHFGVADFGYDAEDFDVFPSISADVLPIVTPSGDESFIDKASLEHLGSVRRDQLLSVLRNHSILFEESAPLGKIPNIKHTIPTTDTQPIRTRQWRLPESARANIREECDKMLLDGVIESSTSPWLSPVVLVRKKDGGIRFCVDYRQLNRVTVADAYPMPRLDQAIDELSGTKWFTALDAKSAYWTIEVDSKDRPKTAFSDGFRLFQFRRMPFGLATAPSTFQRAINAILSPALGKHALAYLDDVVVYSRSFEDHLDHLDEVLDLLERAGFRLNVAKCQFATNSFKFLGFLVTPQGISPDPGKVEAISKMQPPRTARQIRQFLGATGFFRRHVPNYATLAAPLTKLLRKNEKFVWGKEQQAAFEQLKDRLVTAPILRKPDFNKPFEVHSDASGIAIGSCLMQRNEEGIPQAVAYHSRKLRDSERNFPIIDLEALAVVESVRNYNAYLYGRSFIIYTDHRPLIHVFRQPTKSIRMTRWSHELSFYNYVIKYKPGASHHLPDLLSRKVVAIDADFDPQQVAEAQNNDPLWRDVIDYLKERRIPRRKIPLPLDEFELRDDLLYHNRVLPERVIQQLVIPRSLRNKVLELSHCDRSAAHPGIFRTYCRLRDRYYFPQMLSEVRKFVQACNECQRRKGLVSRQAPLASMPDVFQPLERVSADLIDMVPSARGHRYVLVIVDHFSRFLQMVPLVDKGAESVADAFVDHYFTLFGPPRAILTDNGGEFVNNLFKQVCEILKVKTMHTTSYHPQANGMVERVNRVVKDSLAMIIGQHPQDWDKLIPHVRLALNTAIHRSVNQTPLYLLTGRDSYFPAILTNYQDLDEDAARMLRVRLREAREAAVESTRNSRERWARDYNRKVRRRFSPEVGDLVLVRIIRPRRPHRVAALAPRWSRPVRVLKKVGPVNYVVQDPYTPGKELKCHINQLRRYVPREEFEFPEAPRDETQDPDEPADDHENDHGEGEDYEDLAVPGPSGLAQRGGSDTDEDE